jgi:hypothetical protein
LIKVQFGVPGAADDPMGFCKLFVGFLGFGLRGEPTGSRWLVLMADLSLY